MVTVEINNNEKETQDRITIAVRYSDRISIPIDTTRSMVYMHLEPGANLIDIYNHLVERKDEAATSESFTSEEERNGLISVLDENIKAIEDNNANIQNRSDTQWTDPY